MSYYTRMNLPVLALSLLPLAVMASLPGHDKREFTAEFECSGVDVGALNASHNGLFANSTDGVPASINAYFPLVVDSQSFLSNLACVNEGECDELEEVLITVLSETETVVGIETRVVEEREWTDGELVEISRNFYAECIGSGDVFYFGEDVLDGDGEPLPDGWRAGDGEGEEKARPGIIMPGGSFLLGARYFQEYAPGLALDRGEHVEMGLSFEDPYGGDDFENCVMVSDTNALEDPKGKESDEKVYCPGKGLVQDEDAELSMAP